MVLSHDRKCLNFWKQPKDVLVMRICLNAYWSRRCINSQNTRRNKLLKSTGHTYLNFLRPTSQLVNMHIICAKRLSGNYLALVNRMLIPTYSNCTFRSLANYAFASGLLRNSYISSNLIGISCFVIIIALTKINDNILS